MPKGNKAKTDLDRVVKLIDHLTSKEVSQQVSLLHANIVPGWFIQKGSGGKVYDVWPISCRNLEVLHALPPCPHRGITRDEVIELLRNEWVADADCWMVEQAEHVKDLRRMIGIYAPTRAIAQKFIDLRGFPRAQCIVFPTEWNLRGHTEETAVIWIVNGAVPAQPAQDAILLANLPVKQGSVRE